MIMSDIEKLKELIHPQAVLHPAYEKYSQSVFELREIKEANSVIWVAGVPENSIVFNLDDYFQEPDQIFGGSKHESCRSDYVIVTDNNGDKSIVFIEMKSGDDKDYAHMKNQLKGSQSFMGYCQTILDVFWKYNFKFEKYKKHFVICTRTSEHYTQKNDRNASANTDVETPLKLEGSNTYQFNRLIARKPK